MPIYTMESSSISVLMMIFGTVVNLTASSGYQVNLATTRPMSISPANDPKFTSENPRSGFEFVPTKDLYDEALAVVKQKSENFIVERTAKYNVDGAEMNLVLFTGEKQFVTIDDIPPFPAVAPPGVLPIEDLMECAKHWSLINGVGTRSKKNYSKDSVIFVPFTLLPSPFPKSEFERAYNIQPLLNELVHKVAHDHEFLTNSLKTVIELDNFTKRLFDIYETVYKEGFAQEYSVGLFRSDYMLDAKDGTPSIKQIEVNTFAAGYVSYGAQATSLHKFVLERLQRFEDISKLPENKAAEGLGAGLAKACAAILFVVGNESYPIGDHRGHEFGIYKANPRVTVLRRMYPELINGRGKLNENREYIVDGKEIGLVYFRAGYDPSDFQNEEEWQVRFDIERSKALKCPSIQYQLAGMKKNSDGNRAVQMALDNPEHFVLKPQREGGGHNFYGKDITKELTRIGKTKERAGYILMERIIPPSNSTYIIRPNSAEKLEARDVVSELGIFSVIIGSKDKIVINTANGHLHRTKNKMDYEGFILGGTGGLDSPLLYE